MTAQVGGEILIENDAPRYRVTWSALSHVVDFELFEVQSSSFEGEILSEESVLTVGIKWDGCSNWQYTEAYLHFCGVAGLHRFCSVQVWLYAKAAQLLQEAGHSFRGDDVSEFYLDSKKPAEAGPAQQ